MPRICNALHGFRAILVNSIRHATCVPIKHGNATKFRKGFDDHRSTGGLDLLAEMGCDVETTAVSHPKVPYGMRSAVLGALDGGGTSGGSGNPGRKQPPVIVKNSVPACT